MEAGLIELLLEQGLGARVSQIESSDDAPLSIADLASGVSTEEDARSWAGELGLEGRVVGGRFVRAWLAARGMMTPGGSLEGDDAEHVSDVYPGEVYQLGVECDMFAL